MANSDAKRLYDNLLRKSGYNKLIRPVINNTDKLIVKLGLRLSQLIDVVRIHYSTRGVGYFSRMFPPDIPAVCDCLIVKKNFEATNPSLYWYHS